MRTHCQDPNTSYPKPIFPMFPFDLFADKNRLQTASADLRQTDDLLSAGDFDARRSSRGAHNLDAKRSADVARLSRRWGATWYSHRVRRAAEAGRNCAGISNRREIYRRLGRV